MVKQEDLKAKHYEISFPFVKGIIFPLEELYNHFGVFWRLAGGIAFVYALINILLGQNYFCFLQENRTGLFCLDSLFFSLLSFFLWSVFLAYFINRWYLIVYNKVAFYDALKKTCWLKDLKVLGFILAYIGLWVVIGVVFYFLRKRIATPDWFLELMIFVAGSIIVLGAILLLLNSVIFVRFLQGKKWFVINQTVVPIFDNIYKIIFYFIFYLLLFLYLFQYIRVLFGENGFFPLWVNGFLVSFFNYIVLCVLAVCFVASLDFQEKYIFAEEYSSQK